MKKHLILVGMALLSLSSFAKDKPMVIVQIDNAQETADEICAIAKTLGMPIAPQMVLGGLGGSVMNPTLSGIDLEQPIQLFIGQPDPEKPQEKNTVYSFGVEGDGQAYIEAVKQLMPMYGKAKGIHTFTMSLPDGSERNFYVTIKDTRASASPNLATLGSLDQTISTQQKEIADSLSGGVSILLDGPVLCEMIMKQMDASQDMIAEHQAAVEEAGSTNQNPFEMDSVEVMKSYQDMLTLFSKELETVAVSIDLKNDVSIYTHLRAKSESTFEKIISERVAPNPTVSSFNSPDAVFKMFDSLKGVDHILEPYGDFIEAMYRAMGPPFETLADTYKEMMQNLAGLYDGGYNVLFLPPTDTSPLHFAGIYEISDKERMQKLMTDMMKLQNEQMSSIEDSPIVMEMNIVSTSEYRGVQIENIHMKYEMLMDEDMPPGFQNLFSTMTYQIAYLDDYLLYSMGSEQIMHHTIDHSLKTDHVAPTLPGYEDIQEPIIGYWAINLGQTIAAFSSLMQLPAGAGPDLSALSAVQAGLSGVSYNQNGGTTSLTRIKKEELMGFMSMGMMMKPAPAPMKPMPESPQGMTLE